MNIKQGDEIKTNTPIAYNTLLLYGTAVSLGQYLIYDLFRILRPLRVKYKLTINELVLLTGIVTYNKLVSSSFSISAIRRYVGYFSGNKMNYYIKTLLEKGCIVKADIYNGYDRYKVTTKGIEIISSLDECYHAALMKFCSNNGITL